MPKETYIPDLFQLFRQYGYDGVSLSKISQTTGLGKASLYHHFPQGKTEMLQAVLEYVENGLREYVLGPLKGNGSTEEKLEKMCRGIDRIYCSGEQPCILASLQASATKDLFRERLQKLFSLWISAIAEVLIESGMEPELARKKGEDTAIAIQGSLIVSQSLSDPSIFQRVLQELPSKICQI